MEVKAVWEASEALVDLGAYQRSCSDASLSPSTGWAKTFAKTSCIKI